VHPGGVATAIADSARVPKDKPEDEVARGREEMNRVLKLPPETAGEIIVRGVERRQARVLVGSDAWMISVIERLARSCPGGSWTGSSGGHRSVPDQNSPIPLP
jgi:hypothetical protein